MRLDWDPAKEAANRRKHDVAFLEAQTVFDDPLALTERDDEHSEHEERERTIGRSNRERVLFVVTTQRLEVEGELVIRIITARKAMQREVERYGEHIRRTYGR